LLKQNNRLKPIISTNTLLNLKKYTTVALSYFFVVSFLGLLLRFFTVVPINLNFEYILHTHSHTSLLGWLYLGLTLIIYKTFLEQAQVPKLKKRIFIISNISFLGMLVSFPFQGYGLFSIAFSSLYLLASYWFTWFAIKYVPEELKNNFSWKLARAGLFYLVISSLGTWGIAPISATVGLDSFWFNNSLYFFLHFLYSGFFFLTLISVLFRILEKRKVKFSSKLQDKFYVHLNMGIVLSYFLSVIWTKPPVIFYLLGIVGAVYQLYGYYLLYKILLPKKASIMRVFPKYSFFLLKFAAVLLAVRVFMQLISGIPYFTELAFEFKGFIIGYLHMVFLGIITPVLLVFLAHFKMIRLPKNAINLLLFTLIITEIMIFYQAAAYWLKLPLFFSYNHFLTAFSCLFPIAIGWLFIRNLNFAFKR